MPPVYLTGGISLRGPSFLLLPEYDQFAQDIVHDNDQDGYDSLCPEAFNAQKRPGDAGVKQDRRQENFKQAGKDPGADKKKKLPEYFRRSMCMGPENKTPVGEIGEKHCRQPGDKVADRHRPWRQERRGSVDDPVHGSRRDTPEKIGDSFLFQQFFDS